jgi:hypothetical protein
MREIMRIVTLLTKYGFTNYTLRMILMVFLDKSVPLAETLYHYDKMTNDASEIHVRFSGSVTTIVISKPMQKDL